MNFCKNCQHYKKRVEVPQALYESSKTNKSYTTKNKMVVKKVYRLFFIPVWFTCDFVTVVKKGFLLDVCSQNLSIVRDSIGNKTLATYEGDVIFRDCYVVNRNNSCEFYQPKLNIRLRDRVRKLFPRSNA
jgi:hypothetical protein